MTNCNCCLEQASHRLQVRDRKGGYGRAFLRQARELRCLTRVLLPLVFIAFTVFPKPSLAQPAPGPKPSVSARPQDEWTYYGLSRWHIDKRDPERSIPSPEQRDDDPLQFGYFLMDASDLAEAALKRGDHAEAIRYFKTLAKAVPDQAVSFRKICASYQALGDWQNTVAYCKQVLYKEAALNTDFGQYAQVLLKMKPNFTTEDGTDLDEVVLHLRNQMPNDTMADEIACDVGVTLRDNRRMKEGTERLAASAPDNTKTITYQWAYALQRGDFAAARRLIERARRIPLDPGVIHNLEDGLSRYSYSGISGWLRRPGVQLGISVLALFAALMILGSRFKRQPAAARTTESPPERPLLT